MTLKTLKNDLEKYAKMTNICFKYNKNTFLLNILLCFTITFYIKYKFIKAYKLLKNQNHCVVQLERI
jgi:hypothetical protein